MNRLIIKRNVKIDLWDWLLVLGLALAPMTSLRIWKIGPGEVLCALWTIRYLNFKKIVFSDVFKFFTFFIICVSAGTLIGVYKEPQETNPTGILTWVYLGYIACMIYSGLRKRDSEYIEHLFFIGAVVATCWHLLLYLYSITISRSFFGIGLWYGGVRYAGGATNPHQVALLMCGLTVYFLRNVFTKKHVLFSLIMSACCFTVQMATQSSTGLASVVAACLTFMYVFTARLGTSKKLRAGIIIVETLLIILAVIVFFNPLFDFVYNWIASDKNGLGRFAIFSHIGEVFAESPVFGLGTGAHSETLSGNQLEFHNTYLEVLAAGGIAALLALIWFTFRICKKASADAYFYPLIVQLYTFGLAGFGMRRLPYWWLLTFAILTVEKKRTELMVEDDDVQTSDEVLSDEPMK